MTDATDHTSVTPDPTAIGVQLAMKLLKETPKGLGRVTNWVRGRRLLVVGQGRSGKTSFITYLESGLLLEEGYHERSYGWGKRGDREHRKTKQFIVKLGAHGHLQLHVRSAIDVVGQVTAETHGKYVRKHKPHGLVVMTDLSVALSGADGSETWLKEFLDQLSDELREDRSVKRSLKSIVIVLNKADKSDANRTKERQQTFKSLVTSKLFGVLGQRAKRIPILPCVLIDNPKGCKLADAVIAKLAQEISESV